MNGVLDSQQPVLASFRDPSLDPLVAGTDYVTAVTSSGTLSVGTAPVPISGPLDASPITSPLQIRIVGLPLVAGNPAMATLDLYVPAEANSFFAYDEISDTWTDITAVAAFDATMYRAGPGQSVDTRVPVRWRTQLTLEDGGFGDVDGEVDGIITVVGAPSIAETPPDPTIANPDGDGSNYVTVGAYYLLDPATYPASSTYRISPVADVSITAPPSGLPVGNAGLVTGLISYTQTGLALNGQPGAGVQPGDPIPASPATGGTFVWLPYEPNSFWIYDVSTATWTDATSLVSNTAQYFIDPYTVGDLTRWALELLIVDGGFGDADGAVNGEVRVVGAFAATSTDTDGVSDVEEQAAPNDRDGNNDDVPDSEQEAVTSLEDPYLVGPGVTTSYVTMDSTNVGTALADVEIVDPDDGGGRPCRGWHGSVQSHLVQGRRIVVRCGSRSGSHDVNRRRAMEDHALDCGRWSL